MRSLLSNSRALKIKIKMLSILYRLITTYINHTQHLQSRKHQEPKFDKKKS